MKRKPLVEILEKIKKVEFGQEFDMIIAIGRGGVIPAALVNQKLQIEFEIIWIRHRDDQHKPIVETPLLVKSGKFNFKNKNILLVDDVANTGKTFVQAKIFLEGAKRIKTFAVNGKADYSLYNEECFKFPWLLT